VILALAAALTADAAPAPSVLRGAWATYVDRFVSADGRTIDAEAGGITTSEGQAYGMVRAAWADDPATFARLRTWTTNNLQGGDAAALPAWKWGRRDDGAWGVLDPNPASDADQLLAYALLLGADRWEMPALREDAVRLLARLWEQEVGTAGPYRVLLPGPWAVDGQTVRLNPSYFLPFAWRAFAVADPAHPWASLIDDGYTVLARTSGPAGLPPDWVWLDAATGDTLPVPAAEAALGNFGFEAFRVVWTLAAEVRWYGEPRARALLEGMDILPRSWRGSGRVPAILSTAGDPQVDWSYPGMYGALLPAWEEVSRRDARALYRTRLAPRHAGGAWGRPTDYYAQNWIWFGLALWSGLATPPEAS